MWKRNIGELLDEFQKVANRYQELVKALRAFDLSENDWEEMISSFRLDPEIRKLVVGNDIITDMMEILGRVKDMNVTKLEKELEARGHSLHRIRQSISQNAGLGKKVEWADAKRTKLTAVRPKQ